MSEHQQSIIKIKEDYSSLLPALSEHEYQSLKESIKENGLFHPLVVNQEKELLDGHHRYRACQELQIEYKVEVKDFNDPLYEKLFVIHSNLKRRQLTSAQKVEIGHTLKPIYQEIAKRNSLSNLRQNKKEDGRELGSTGSPEPVGRVNEAVAKEVGLSRATFQKGETVLSQAAQIWSEQVKTGKVTINKAFTMHQKSLRKEELTKSAQADTIELPENAKLVQGDFIQVSTKELIPNNFIDLIFTDPPYGMNALTIYADLAVTASRVLKVGGSLVTYVGHCTIPNVIKFMETVGLTYWWPIAVKLSGQFARSYPRGISIKWKPLLWFVKGQKKNAVDFLPDFIESKAPDKALHEWEQSPIEAEHVISRLTVENQIVFDPMMGSGSTGVAALILNRKFIGIEKDKERFEIAKMRINMSSTAPLLSKHNASEAADVEVHTQITPDHKNLIKLVEEFFSDMQCQPLPEHDLEASPCYPIIEKDMLQTMRRIYYRCKLHPEVWNIDLRGIEHHCKYDEPDDHKTQILKLLTTANEIRDSWQKTGG